MEKLKRYDFIINYNDVQERNLKLIQIDAGPFIFDPDMELKPQESASDSPTEPGWYWYKHLPDDDWVVHEIRFNSQNELHVRFVDMPIKHLKGSWSGPIKEPNES